VSLWIGRVCRSLLPRRPGRAYPLCSMGGRERTASLNGSLNPPGSGVPFFLADARKEMNRWRPIPTHTSLACV
jgi:hypothetical protein